MFSQYINTYSKPYIYHPHAWSVTKKLKVVPTKFSSTKEDQSLHTIKQANHITEGKNTKLGITCTTSSQEHTQVKSIKDAHNASNNLLFR